MGDQFNLSGDFRGSIINLKSTLRDVQQTAGMIPGASDDERKQLQDLIARLMTELEKVPPEKSEEVETVALTASTLVEQVKGEKKNKTLVKITGEGLKEAANNLASILPSLLPIVTQMVTVVTRMSGG